MRVSTSPERRSRSRSKARRSRTSCFRKVGHGSRLLAAAVPLDRDRALSTRSPGDEPRSPSWAAARNLRLRIRERPTTTARPSRRAAHDRRRASKTSKPSGWPIELVFTDAARGVIFSGPMPTPRRFLRLGGLAHADVFTRDDRLGLSPNPTNLVRLYVRAARASRPVTRGKKISSWHAALGYGLNAQGPHRPQIVRNNTDRAEDTGRFCKSFHTGRARESGLGVRLR